MTIVIPARAKREARVVDIFSSVQARVIDLMGGGAAEMVFLGDAPPMFMANDMLGAIAIELIPRDVCRIEPDPEEFALAIVDL